MSEEIKINVHQMPTRITIDMSHETYKEFSESCQLLDDSMSPGDHIGEMIRGRLESYERARADAPMAVQAQLEREGGHRG